MQGGPGEERSVDRTLSRRVWQNFDPCWPWPNPICTQPWCEGSLRVPWWQGLLMYCVLLRKHIQLHFIPVLSKFHHNSLDFFFSRALKIRYHMSSFQEMTGPNRALNKMHYWRLVYLFTYILAQMFIHVENQRGEKNQAIKSCPDAFCVLKLRNVQRKFSF